MKALEREQCLNGVRGRALPKKFEKSKNFFENPGRFRKKSDYIGEGHFRRRAPHGVGADAAVSFQKRK